MGLSRTCDGDGYFSHQKESFSEAAPMKIKNIQRQRTRSDVQLQEKQKTNSEKGAYFTFHAVGCRPWKHKRENVNPIQADGAERNFDSDIKCEETIESSSGSEK